MMLILSGVLAAFETTSVFAQENSASKDDAAFNRPRSA